MYKWVVTPSASFPKSRNNECCDVSTKRHKTDDSTSRIQDEKPRMDTTWDNRELLDSYVRHDIALPKESCRQLQRNSRTGCSPVSSYSRSRSLQGREKGRRMSWSQETDYRSCFSRRTVRVTNLDEQHSSISHLKHLESARRDSRRVWVRWIRFREHRWKTHRKTGQNLGFCKTGDGYLETPSQKAVVLDKKRMPTASLFFRNSVGLCNS